MSLGVIANPIAAFLLLVYDLWPAAAQCHCGIASRVHCGISFTVRTAKSCWRVHILETTANETWRQEKVQTHFICRKWFITGHIQLHCVAQIQVIILNTQKSSGPSTLPRFSWCPLLFIKYWPSRFYIAIYKSITVMSEFTFYGFL